MLHANPFRCDERPVYLDQHRPRRHPGSHANKHGLVQRKPRMVAIGDTEGVDGGIG
jgi:hypothetical protein